MNETPKESQVASPANTGTLQSLDTRTKFFKKEPQRQVDTNPKVSEDAISA